jgi:hypothetical protein
LTLFFVDDLSTEKGSSVLGEDVATTAEAFGQSFELEDFEELVSYSLIMNRLENPLPDA